MALSEQEQAERLKAWWKKNAVPAAAGILLGLGAIGGYNWWNITDEARRESASDLFDELVESVIAESARIAEDKAAADDDGDGDGDGDDGDADAADDADDGGDVDAGDAAADADGGDDGDTAADDGDGDGGDGDVAADDGDSDGDGGDVAAGDGDSEADGGDVADGDGDDVGDDGDTAEPEETTPETIAQQLRDEHGGLDYAAQATLLVARLAVERDDLTAARGHLQWVVDNAAKPATLHAARVRLARLQLEEGEVDAAAATVAVDDTGGFVSHYEELRGDIFVAQENFSEARAAYERALAALPTASAYRALLELKLDNAK